MTNIGLMALPESRAAGSLHQRNNGLARMADAGLDHVANADHVSFFVGYGCDGLVDAASLLASGSLPVYVALYLLPLRHPVVVARQIATLAEAAPGRLTLGVGIGGEDRHEVANCGVDPATRGARMNESLAIVRKLLTGRPLTHHGEFFDLEEATILPAPDPPVDLIVGGRSDAAIRRAATLGDGWLGIWASPGRFASVVTQISEIAAAAGRPDPPYRHGLNVWCGVDASRVRARHHVANAMEAMYQMPFESFERWSPYGTPADIAEFVAPYLEAGAADINLICQGPDRDTVIEAAGEIRRILKAEARSAEGSVGEVRRSQVEHDVVAGL